MTEPLHIEAEASRAAQRVALILRERIEAGLYPPGARLPTERALAQEFHVHRRVVREAVGLLAEEGTVDHLPNCRPVVSASRLASPAAPPVSPAPKTSSRFVALVMWHGGGPFERTDTPQQRIFWGMNSELGTAGYHAVFMDLGDMPGTEDENAAREAAHLQHVMDESFAGVVFYPYAYGSNRDLIQKVSRRVPMVIIDRTVPGVPVDYVGVGNHRAMYDETMHLLALGHRRIAFVMMPEPINPVQDRLQGYLAAIRSMGDPVGVPEIVLPRSVGPDTPWPVLDAVFRLPASQRPTAAACTNDYQAVDLVRRLEQLGLRVPEDVAVAGFDDIVQRLPNGVGLTTLAQPYEEIGRTAARLLVRRMGAPALAPQAVELPATLVVRESTQSA